MPTLVRIYQGRLDEPSSAAAAEHFAIFQAAINYYLLALCALETRSLGPLADLKGQIVRERWERWTDRRGVGRAGLRDSLAEWLGSLAGHPVEDLEEAWRLLRPEAQVDRRAWTAALDLLLDRCGGEGSIQHPSSAAHGHAISPGSRK